MVQMESGRSASPCVVSRRRDAFIFAELVFNHSFQMCERLTIPQPEQQRHQLRIPVFNGTGRHLAQQCRLLVPLGLDILNFKHFRCSQDTPTLSCAMVLHAGLSTVSTFLAHLAWLTEWWSCALTATVLWLLFTTFPQWHRSRPNVGHQASSPDADRGSPSVVLVLVSSLAVPADGCGCFRCTSHRVSCWIPLLYTRNSFRDGGHDMR